LSATPGDELTESSIAEMKNHVIVMGYKLLGTYVVEKLKEMGLNYVILV